MKSHNTNGANTMEQNNNKFVNIVSTIMATFIILYFVTVAALTTAALVKYLFY
jgi:hypothetical protein